MSVVLQISDPHFGTERVEVVEALRRLSRALSPELLVLSGDITQRARAAQFAAARAFVDSLEAPAVLAIPGNHDLPLFDLPARLFAPYAAYKHAFGEELEPIYASPDWLVVGVNTTRAYRHKNGEVSAKQVNAVSRRLSEATARQIRMVVTHQPAAVVQPRDHANRLRGADVALSAWAVAGADLIVGGHIHLPYVVDGAAMPDKLLRRLWIVQAGTAVSRRTRGLVRNSVNVFRSDTRDGLPWCVAERWDYVVAEDAFLRVSERALDLER